MTKKCRAQAVLLLADGFDEAPMAVVATKLREAGLSVVIVGLRAGQVSGKHGINLRPDMSLDRFLRTTSPIAALILPEGVGHLERLSQDPRVNTLLNRTLSERALFVGLGHQTSGLLDAVAQNNGGSISKMVYDALTGIDEFADALGLELMVCR